ncbi:MAG: GntR family transcriptional regulator [Anaerolineales bacterium]|nr:GntR family transcriptional regulator [Anaerolineales bacterium]MCB0006393.1 GntR family transcriptional regulator [Anaerolineales bacterium]MCB0017323.1 GntR family transcriptional regulator [Anaerolineales bacterium]MCB0030156.1 GntR family transcriptional regulator [Anaerolineales bacterium]MCB8959995.1 GntR family transcriptional regulator [Ardenticatenales bacterium]
MNTVFRSKHEVVYELLHQAIIRGEYEPGQRLVIDDLASRYGVSAIPIREALRQLEADGFVEIAPYVGATVTEISADSVFEIFGLLETMEAIGSRSACRCLSDAELATLDELVVQMDEALETPDEWSRLNKAFHLQICEYAHTTLIKEMMRKVLDHWDRLRQHYMKDVLGLRLVQAQAEHRQIMAAFHERDAEEVERLIRVHNQHALASYNNYLLAAGHLHEKAEAGGC